MSGGAGYVLSVNSLEALVEQILVRPPSPPQPSRHRRRPPFTSSSSRREGGRGGASRSGEAKLEEEEEEGEGEEEAEEMEEAMLQLFLSAQIPEDAAIGLAMSHIQVLLRICGITEIGMDEQEYRSLKESKARIW